MFSRIIKRFFLKKIIKKRLSKYNLDVTNDKIKTIGIIVDTTYFFDKEKLILEIKSHSNHFEDIRMIAYRDKIKNKSENESLFFSMKDITITGGIGAKHIQDFVDYPFDLLINYFDEEKLPLLLIAKKSKAKFKMGFSTVDKRIHHFMLALEMKNYKEFVSELFKYLKILNKI